jgi:hypothetical protein
MTRGAWLAAIQIELDVGCAQQHSGRATIDDAADTGAMRFTK